MALKKSKKDKGKARKINYVEIDSEKGEDEVGGESNQEHDNRIDENGGSESKAGFNDDEENFPPINQSKNTAPVTDLLLSLPRLRQILDRYCVSYQRFHQLLILI